MPSLGLGHRWHGPREFTFIVKHDIPYGLAYTPTKDDARHMAQLHRNKVRARLSRVSFDYPLPPYTFNWLTNLLEGQSMHSTQGVLIML